MCLLSFVRIFRKLSYLLWQVVKVNIFCGTNFELQNCIYFRTGEQLLRTRHYCPHTVSNSACRRAQQNTAALKILDILIFFPTTNLISKWPTLLLYDFDLNKIGIIELNRLLRFLFFFSIATTLVHQLQITEDMYTLLAFRILQSISFYYRLGAFVVDCSCKMPCLAYSYSSIAYKPDIEVQIILH